MPKAKSRLKRTKSPSPKTRQLAKSRLKKSKASNIKIKKPIVTFAKTKSSKSSFTKKKVNKVKKSKTYQQSRLTTTLSSFFEKRTKYISFIILSILPVTVIYYIITSVHPNQIRHLIIPNTYLPILIAFFIAASLFFKFLFLKTQHAIIASIIATLLLFLKLQKFILPWWILLPVFLLVVVIVILDNEN